MEQSREAAWWFHSQKRFAKCPRMVRRQLKTDFSIETLLLDKTPFFSLSFSYSLISCLSEVPMRIKENKSRISNHPKVVNSQDWLITRLLRNASSRTAWQPKSQMKIFGDRNLWNNAWSMKTAGFKRILLGNKQCLCKGETNCAGRL